jgi:2-dehydropantoate 2-reductase
LEPKRIAVVGTGANGAAIGADLVNAGLDVTFVEQWPAHVEAMRANGIRVEMPHETTVTRVDAFHLCEVAEMRDPFDLVFLLVKAYDTRWASELIKPLLTDDGIAVGLQNGMSIEDMAEIFGHERTLGGVIEVSSNMFTPGVVERQSPPSRSWFALGSFHESTRGREGDVATVLKHAGAVEVVDDIRSAKWMKLVANAAELVPSAILNLSIIEAASIPEMRAFMDACGREAIRAALATGRTLVPIFGKTEADVLEPDLYATNLLDAILDEFLLPDTKSTVLQDWIKGRRSEVSEVNGLVVDVLNSHDQVAPANAIALDLAKRIEMGELSPSLSNLDPILKGFNGGSRTNTPIAQIGS